MPLHPESPIDVLATSRAVLETAKEVSDAVSVVPLLGIVLGAFANLLKAVKDVQGADSRAKRLRQRAVEFRGYIERTVLEHQDAVNTDICTQLSALYETLHDIRKAIENMQKRRFITRLIRKSSISDMLDEHLETLESAWRSFMDGRRRWNGVTLPTLPEEYYNILRQVLAHLTGKQQPSQLGISLKTWKTWRVEKYYYKLPRINLGDFGYYQPGSASDDDDAAVFVRLGNLSELLPSSVSATIIWEYSPPSGTQAHSDSIERYLTCKLPRSRKTHITHGRESSKSLKQECVDYWWDNIFDIASTYGRAVHELILVRDIYEWATAEAVGSCNTHHWCGPSTHMRPDIEKPCLEYKDVPDPGPIDVYFHFNIPQESLPRESREPWGYWSLEPEPSPGPWPKISMPGLSLDQDSLLRCEQLTRLEADLFSHLRDMQEQERCAGDSGVRFAEMGDC
ncbi:hypothetical protein CERSUDRAFT_100352 [Gelatoporia subvermispora B]|uniref:Uncharacterized protein n=1 Tax=Ceriporiopsis subvermispora (strain B) TaxID=914234 RepID=M2QYA1_CERS8|nr:hypothetical protein CERSUDRAFT_100352 [Gelatoporia subvermispora B]